MMEIALGILSLVRKFNAGERTKERKTARKKGKSTGFASRKTTPTIKMTMIKREAVATLLLFTISLSSAVSIIIESH